MPGDRVSQAALTRQPGSPDGKPGAGDEGRGSKAEPFGRSTRGRPGANKEALSGISTAGFQRRIPEAGGAPSGGTEEGRLGCHTPEFQTRPAIRAVVGL